MSQQLDQANRECKHTHKDTDGNWVQHEKPKNPITKTIERYAEERHLPRAESEHREGGARE